MDAIDKDLGRLIETVAAALVFLFAAIIIGRQLVKRSRRNESLR